jgi:hypothetical protein
MAYFTWLFALMLVCMFLVSFVFGSVPKLINNRKAL